MSNNQHDPVKMLRVLKIDITAPEQALIKICYVDGTHKTKLVPIDYWYRNNFGATKPYISVERLAIVKKRRNWRYLANSAPARGEEAR